MTPENLEPNYARLFHEATAKEGEVWHEITNYTIVKDGRVITLATCSCSKTFLFNASLDEHIKYYNRTFTTAQDKQDLLEAVIKKGEWMEFLSELNDIWKENLHFPEFSAWLIQLSPLKTAELICKWKGVE